MDLPMIVPKTVSEVWAENRGTEMGRAIYLECIWAKDRAMALAESLAMTRVRRGDADYSRYTGNLLYLSVIHEDARPVGSDVPDPMLHAHNYIFNLTWDEEERRLKAVDLHDVLKRAETIDALFLSELERGLQRLGIGTERTAFAVELDEDRASSERRTRQTPQAPKDKHLFTPFNNLSV